MKKILFVTSWYPSEEVPHKGIFVREYAAALHLSGCPLAVFVLDFKGGFCLFNLKKTFSSDKTGFVVYRLTICSMFWKGIYFLTPLLNFLSYNFLRKHVFASFSPDVIHAHVIHPAGGIAWCVSRKIRKPYLITEHWSEIAPYLKRTPYRKAALKSYNEANYIVTVSHFLKESISGYIKNKSFFRVIPNIISDAYYFKQEADDANIVFVAVANWIPPKNPLLIYQALKEFSKTAKKTVVFNLIGDGRLLNDIPRNEDTGNLKMNFYGVLKKENIAEIMHKSHYLLHCSEMETFSIVIAEALSCGLPVLASKRGAITELITEKNGFVCQNTLIDWLEGLNLLTEAQYDREAISNDALAKFQTGHIIKEYITLYNNM